LDGKNPLNYDVIKNIIEEDNNKIFFAEKNNTVIGHCILNIQKIKNHNIFKEIINIVIDDLSIDENHRKKVLEEKNLKK